MIAIKIKDESGVELTVDANSVLCVVENKSSNTSVRSLVIFKGNHFGYLFSCEEYSTILDRIKQAQIDDGIATALETSLSGKKKNDLTTYDDCIGLTD